MDPYELSETMIRFHVLRAQEAQAHLETLRSRIREVFPTMNEAKANRLLAMLDEEVTRANIRWLQSAVNDREWLARRHLPEPEAECESSIEVTGRAS